MADLKVHNCGSIYLLRPISEAGQVWIDEHIPDDALTLGNAIAVEPRYVGSIVDGAIEDGLVVE